VSTWQLPDIRRFRLPSGLTVWLLERAELPIVSLILVFPEGANEDPPGHEGTAHLTGSTLDTGTASRSALEISGTIERLGSSLHVQTAHDGITISLASLQRNLQPSLEVLGDILAHATFPAAELERKRAQHLTGIAQQKDRASTIASWAFYRLLYGAEHPYGTDSGGTEASVRRIGREETAGFMGQHLTPDSCTAIIIGPVSETDSRTLLGDTLPAWDAQRRQRVDSTPPQPQTRQGFFLIDRPGSAQAEIRMGKPSLKRNSPDFFPVILLNRVLGGQFSSRLNANLRERRGFTYGAWSSFGMGRLGGPFLAGTAVNTADAGEAVRELLGELDGMARGNLTAEELRFAREGIAGSFALMFETPAQVAGVLQNIVFYDLGEEYYASYLAKLRGVTLEQANAVARKYISSEDLTVVLVGDAAKIAPLLPGRSNVTATTLEELGL
jgi:zinc protease